MYGFVYNQTTQYSQFLEREVEVLISVTGEHVLS